MPELSDEEYQFLQQRRQVADFVESIYNDPALTKEAKALIKKKYPQVSIPDYDIEERISKRLDDDRKERDDAEKAKREAADQESFKQTRARVQKEFGFTDEGMNDLEKFMLEKNVGDYDVAASYHAMKNPKQSEATHSDGLWNHQKSEGWNKISEDPEGWARGEILGALRRDEDRQKGGRF
jgi:hypothetical protein